MDDYKDNEGTADQVGAIQQQNDPGTTSKKSPEKNIDSDDRNTIEEVSTEKKKRNEVKNNTVDRDYQYLCSTISK